MRFSPDLFPTPVFLHDVPGSDKNELLYTLVQNLRAEDPKGVTKSNRDGGWHSADTVDIRVLPEMVDIQKVILDAARLVLDGTSYDGLGLVLISAWFIVSPVGASNIRHSHPRSFLSGVYYVKVPSGSSPIVFHPEAQSSTVSFEAKENRLLIFPGWLEHSVAPNSAAEERVVLSFNLGAPC